MSDQISKIYIEQYEHGLDSGYKFKGNNRLQEDVEKGNYRKK